MASLDGHREAIVEAVARTQDFAVRSWYGSYFTTRRDLFDFAEKIKAALPSQIELCRAADLVLKALAGPGGFVIANGTTDVSPAESVRNAHGVAIYLPVTG